MALNNIPDFSIKAPFPMAAVIQAYQNKAAMEQQNKIQREQLEMQKFDQTLKVFNAAADITGNIIQYNAQKQQQSALNNLSSLFQSGTNPIQQNAIPSGQANLSWDPSGNTNQPTTIGTGTPQSVPFAATPEYKFQLASMMTQADPKSITEPIGKNIANSMFPETQSQRAFAPQQSAIELTDGKVVPATFKDGQYYYANSDQLIPREMIAGKGYAPKLTQNSQGENVLVSPNTAMSKTVAEQITPTANKTEEFTALPKVQQQRIVEKSEKFLSDPIITNIREKSGNLQEYKRLIDTALDKSPENAEAARQAYGAMQGLATRTLGGEKGVTTDKDIGRNTGDQSLVGKFRRYVSVAATGEIPDDQLRGFRTLLDKIDVAQEKKVERIKESYIRPLEKSTRASRELLESQFELDLGNSSQPAPKITSNELPSVGQMWNGMKVKSIKLISK